VHPKQGWRELRTGLESSRVEWSRRGYSSEIQEGTSAAVQASGGASLRSSQALAWRGSVRGVAAARVRRRSGAQAAALWMHGCGGGGGVRVRGVGFARKKKEQVTDVWGP